mmetsp:Transcript_30624/g.72882  ORF Transcript_30624/g.72882 Transcript_30624/m.72882 type:complete len:186 (-) Transcript_30624:347-904(-)
MRKSCQLQGRRDSEFSQRKNFPSFHKSNSATREFCVCVCVVNKGGKREEKKGTREFCCLQGREGPGNFAAQMLCVFVVQQTRHRRERDLQRKPPRAGCEPRLRAAGPEGEPRVPHRDLLRDRRRASEARCQDPHGRVPRAAWTATPRSAPERAQISRASVPRSCAGWVTSLSESIHAPPPGPPLQ